MLSAFLIAASIGMQAAPQPKPISHAEALAAVPAAAPADVSSPEAIVTALYSVISGDAGVKRDWKRFHSLFYPGARTIPTGMNPETKKAGARIDSLEEYIRKNRSFLEDDGFHEVEVARRMERFGNIAHVLSTYESRHKLSDPKPFMRGINSIQLLNDGSRWWILSVAWSQETPDHPIPAKYLKSGD